MRQRVTAEQIKIAKSIDLINYMKQYEPMELIRTGPHDYKTASHSSLCISDNGLWHWFSHNIGGRGALNYLIQVKGMDFVSAVRHLCELEHLEPVPFQQVKRAPVQERKPFVMPVPDKNAETALQYLKRRGIDGKILKYCVDQGILYQTTRGGYKNCVFVGKDTEGKPRSACVRGCQGTFRGECAGSEKQYGFCIPADNDKAEILEMLYTQIFDQLFRLADSNPEYKGALPVHVRLMMDEFANVALPKDFKKILSVCRSRNISCDIILQSIAQLKSLFKDDWEGIVGNCDSLLYLGGNEYGTFEYLSKILGKETERTVSHSIGRGSHGSSSESQQKAARDLATPDEIRRMSNDDALLLLRSEDPVVDRKYDLLKHPNIKMTTDGGAAPYVMPYDFMQMAVSISQKELATIEPDKIPAETLDKYELIDLEEIENAA